MKGGISMGTRISKNGGGYLYLGSPKEQLMKMLVEKTITTGHTLSFKEASEDPEMANPNNYAFYFGSFKEAAELAWKKATDPQRQTSTSAAKVVQIPESLKKPEKPKPSNAKRYKALLEKRLFGMSLDDDVISMPLEGDEVSPPALTDNTNLGPAGSHGRSRTKKYTYEQVKGMLIAFYGCNGRMPTQADAILDPSLPSWATLYKYLGHKSEWDKFIPVSLRGESTKDEPAIDANYYWKNDTLLVEVKVLKPGIDVPISITLTV